MLVFSYAIPYSSVIFVFAKHAKSAGFMRVVAPLPRMNILAALSKTMNLVINILN